jgi:hypothetical protein
MAIFKAIIRSIRRILKPKKRRRRAKPRKTKKIRKTTRRPVKRKKPVRRKKSVRRKAGTKVSRPSRRPKKRRKLKRPLRPQKRKKPQPALKSRLSRKVELKSVQQGILVGEITHYFDKIKVCVVKVTKGGFKIGDRLRIQSGETGFIQKVGSIQVESVDVKTARKGQLVGMKVDRKVHEGATVYKV